MIIEKDNFCIFEEREGFSIAIFSSIGDREEQQDCAGYSLGYESGMVVLCDGMGGHQDGKTASKLAVKTMLEEGDKGSLGANSHEVLCHAAKVADKAVHGISDENGVWKKAGSTLTAVIINSKSMYWLSVGDSRIYLSRNGVISQLNTDHIYSKVLDERLRRSEITMEKYSDEISDGDALISFLGLGELELIDGNSDPIYLQPDDKILMMSDGLYKIMQDKDIASVIDNFTNTADALRALEYKVRTIAKHDFLSRDNMTLALIKVK